MRRSDRVVRIISELRASNNVLVKSTDSGTSWNGNHSVRAAKAAVASDRAIVHVLDWIIGARCSDTILKTLISAVDGDTLEDSVTRDDWEDCGSNRKELHDSD